MNWVGVLELVFVDLPSALGIIFWLYKLPQLVASIGSFHNPREHLPFARSHITNLVGRWSTRRGGGMWGA